jgi:hypothetical protein
VFDDLTFLDIPLPLEEVVVPDCDLSLPPVLGAPI